MKPMDGMFTYTFGWVFMEHVGKYNYLPHMDGIGYTVIGDFQVNQPGKTDTKLQNMVICKCSPFPSGYVQVPCQFQGVYCHMVDVYIGQNGMGYTVHMGKLFLIPRP